MAVCTVTREDLQNRQRKQKHRDQSLQKAYDDALETNRSRSKHSTLLVDLNKCQSSWEKLKIKIKKKLLSFKKYLYHLLKRNVN